MRVPIGWNGHLPTIPSTIVSDRNAFVMRPNSSMATLSVGCCKLTTYLQYGAPPNWTEAVLPTPCQLPQIGLLQPVPGALVGGGGTGAAGAGGGAGADGAGAGGVLAVGAGADGAGAGGVLAIGAGADGAGAGDVGDDVCFPGRVAGGRCV
jgi:hypothetical protein